MKQIAKVRYFIGPYTGTLEVNCNAFDDDNLIIARAKKQLMKSAGGYPVGMCYESFQIINRVSA